MSGDDKPRRKSVSFSGVEELYGENISLQQPKEEEEGSIVFFCDESTGLLHNQQQHESLGGSWDTEDDSDANYDSLTASWHPNASFSSSVNNDNNKNKQTQTQAASTSTSIGKPPPIPPPNPIAKRRTTSVTFENSHNSRERFYSCENSNHAHERFYSCDDDIEKQKTRGENQEPKRNGKELWKRVYNHLDTLVLKSKWSSILDDDNDEEHGDEILDSRNPNGSSRGGGAKLGNGSTSRGDCNSRQGKERLAKKIQQTVETPLYTCLVAMVIYLCISVLAYSFIFEQWPIVDSLYFAVVTFTTIGYGDLSPSTDASKFFTCFYALIGIVSLGIALGVLGSNVIESQVSAIDSAQKMSQYYTLNLFGVASRVGKRKGNRIHRHGDHDDKEVSPGNAEGHEVSTIHSEDEENKIVTDGDSRQWRAPPLLLVVLRIFILSFLSSFLIGSEQKWGWMDTLYYCIVSATTIGYGDLAPSSKQSRALAVFVIPIMVACIGEFLHELSSSIIERRQARYRRELFEKHNFRMCDLEAMAGGDGSDSDEGGASESRSVTREDFVAFMLLAMKKVDEGLIQELHAQFERLDVDKSGTLTRADLVAIARRKLKSTKRKLRLARYKQHLLSKRPPKKRRPSLWVAFQQPSSSNPSYDWQASLALLSEGDTESIVSDMGGDTTDNTKEESE